MSEIIINWSSLFPVLWEIRFLAFVVGVAIFIHALCMAGFVPEKTPWAISIVMAFAGGAGLCLVIGALAGNFPMILLAGLVSSASITTMALWLWYHGLHISKFIDKNYGNS